MTTMKTFKQHFTESEDIKVGDTILTGRFKNSPAVVKGFGTDKNNQPTVKTTKGEISLYKFRIQKLMKAKDESVTESQDTKSDLQAISDKWRSKGVDLFLYPSGEDIRINTIVVPMADRKMGIGTQAMNDVIEYADSSKRRVILSLGQKDKYRGTTSSGRLRKFYKRFGFVDNKGRNKDFTISDSMYRIPQ